MNEAIVVISGIIGAVVGAISIACFIFYTKAQVDDKLIDFKTKLLKRIDDNQLMLTKEIAKVNETSSDKILEVERQNNTTLSKIVEELGANKLALQEAVSVIQESFSDKLMVIKDELKNDYMKRYDDLMRHIESKLSKSEYTRMEQKVDGLSQSIIELKTIIQYQMTKEEAKK